MEFFNWTLLANVHVRFRLEIKKIKDAQNLAFKLSIYNLFDQRTNQICMKILLHRDNLEKRSFLTKVNRIITIIVKIPTNGKF